MKTIVFFLTLVLSVSLYAEPPLVKVAKEELNYSKRFVKLESHQQKQLYDYVRLLKARYVSTKEIVWLSTKIVDAIYIESSMLQLRKQ